MSSEKYGFFTFFKYFSSNTDASEEGYNGQPHFIKIFKTNTEGLQKKFKKTALAY